MFTTGSSGAGPGLGPARCDFCQAMDTRRFRAAGAKHPRSRAGFFDILDIDPFVASSSLSLTAPAVSEGIDLAVHRPSTDTVHWL